MTDRHVRRWPRRAAAVVLGLAAALAFAELGLRALGLPRPLREFVVNPSALPDVFVEDPDTFWRLAPDNGVYDANRLGLRGPCPAGGKTDRELRVVCVGDSSTFGLGHGYDEAYGARLGRLLQHAYPWLRVETLLAALPAYSTYQNRVQFRRDIVELAPDVTIFYCGAHNDGMAAVGLGDAARAARHRSRAANPLYALRIVRLVARAGDAAVASDDIERHVRERPNGPRVTEAEFRENLSVMIGLARDAGGLVVVIPPPHARIAEQGSALGLRYRELARQIGVEAGTLLLDAPNLLRGESDDPLGPWFDDPIHPSAAGHRRLAQALFELLQPALADRLLAAGQVAPSGPARGGGGGIEVRAQDDRAVRHG